MTLSAEDSRVLEQCFRGGIQPVRTVRRALIVRQLGQGESCRKIAAQVGVAVSTVYEVRRRYEELGLEAALYDRRRAGGKPLLKPSERQQIIAMVCGAPPAGQGRWTVRLIAAEAVQRALVPKVGRETIRVLLQNHDLQPWREKNVVRGAVGPALHRTHGRCTGRL
jgi:transposase